MTNNIPLIPITQLRVSSHTFAPAVRQLVSPAHVSAWRRSQAHADLTHFIQNINYVIRSTACSQVLDVQSSHAIDIIVRWLQGQQSLLSRHPPIQQAMRFGNKAYRLWYDDVAASIDTLHVELLSPLEVVFDSSRKNGAADELSGYLRDSFGNYQRIDYGTGHELNFVLWLLCLHKLGLIPASELPQLALRVFAAYLRLMRAVQSLYWLEPAGSKGAWGLDDYQFLPFLWGSSQLIGTDIPCKAITDSAKVSEYAGDYLFFGAIQFILQVKTGPFNEHSVMLHQISELQGWKKANAGLMRMYDAEVLMKYPVVQHILFGSILTLQPAADDAEEHAPANSTRAPS